MWRLTTPLCIAFGLCAASCGTSPSGELDSGDLDPSQLDSGRSQDASTSDSGSQEDASTADAGRPEDASASDSGNAQDASASDGGAQRDAQISDAGPDSDVSDGGGSDSEPPPNSADCTTLPAAVALAPEAGDPTERSATLYWAPAAGCELRAQSTSSAFDVLNDSTEEDWAILFTNALPGYIEIVSFSLQLTSNSQGEVAALGRRQVVRSFAEGEQVTVTFETNSTPYSMDFVLDSSMVTITRIDGVDPPDLDLQ